MTDVSAKDDTITRVFVIDQSRTGQRLDVFLSSELVECSRSRVQKLIQAGYVKVNDRIQKPGYILRINDVVRCELAQLSPSTDAVIEPVAIPLDIIYEDRWIVVVNKPPGLVVHPGAGQADYTLVHGLLYHCESLASVGAPLRPGIVHRLDQGTSGVMVVAKTDEAYFKLIDQFKNRTVEKKYLAFVWGVPKTELSPIVTLIDRHPVNRKKMAVSKTKGREAITYWKILESWGVFSLVEAKPVTGRTHQIRVHFSYIHHPVVGDELYSNHKSLCKNLKDEKLRRLVMNIDHQMLHAASIAFNHPISGERLSFSALPPEDMVSVVTTLSSSHSSRYGLFEAMFVAN
ncbi:MAG: RluA family pseudouridine synthase [Thermodesulforhabdaceae bacterium]